MLSCAGNCHRLRVPRYHGRKAFKADTLATTEKEDWLQPLHDALTHMFKEAGSLEVTGVEQKQDSADSRKDEKPGPAGGPDLQAADVTLRTSGFLDS